MLTEVTELRDMPVYTDRGVLVGTVTDVILDSETQEIYGLYIDHPNSELVEMSSAISIPFRWIKAIGQIVLLRKFPAFLKIPQE